MLGLKIDILEELLKVIRIVKREGTQTDGQIEEKRTVGGQIPRHIENNIRDR